ncbi:MAG TPA: Asp-tRNA(Asn)/Glu-tRNA(Gln) amidotransferase subunit GatC [Paenalcaligenes sp.]|nr:Asp-tRNA(Asn)/Glu-tRNA(Gln) amidotransferase subunit GatC [Paenalcaligenes sp.]
MTVTKQDVAHIAQLAQIELSATQTEQAINDFSHILTLIKQLESVDTSDVTPLVNPLTAMPHSALRWRDDAPGAPLTKKQHDTVMANAPAQQDGLFLVPTVIE